jgi:hypothetical protein
VALSTHFRLVRAGLLVESLYLHCCILKSYSLNGKFSPEKFNLWRSSITVVRANLTAQGETPQQPKFLLRGGLLHRACTVAVLLLPKVDLHGVGAIADIAEDCTGLIQKMIILQLSEVLVT